MTTLEAIGFNLAAGAGLGTVSLLAFGLAVRLRHEYIAPRCSARPKNVIFNPDAAASQDVVHPQDRGNPWTGWIPWTLDLTYDALLQGVPGTGTRQKGMAGSLLRCNLDAIVLLRFHAVGVKVSAVATILSLGILLPMYWTSKCYDEVNSENLTSDWETACATSEYNLTDYERTTLANVPAAFDDDPSTNNGGGGLGVDVGQQNQESTIRLYFCVFCFWIISGYLVYLLKREWIEILALRRVYYLEANVWGERCDELSELEVYTSSRQKQQETYDTKKTEMPPPMALQQKLHHAHRLTTQDEDESRLVLRDPWIPHPEHRDTVPNIQLYSVLVGGLPSLPEEEGGDAAGEDVATTKRDSMDWQLALTATFFDHCVPNQPGFSSSVAAVTILPSSKSVSGAWKKWYIAASKLRRLRFIRSQMALKYQDEMLIVLPTQGENDGEAEVNDDDHNGPRDVENGQNGAGYMGRSFGDASIEVDDGPMLEHQQQQEQQDDRQPDGSGHVSPTPAFAPIQGSRENAQQLRDYYEALVRDDNPILTDPANENSSNNTNGKMTTEERERLLHKLLRNPNFGPEQTAVYSREFAQAAAPCCPNGCCERAVHQSTLEELKIMEKEAEDAVLAANDVLWAEQQHIRQARVLSNHTGNAENNGTANGGGDNRVSVAEGNRTASGGDNGTNPAQERDAAATNVMGLAEEGQTTENREDRGDHPTDTETGHGTSDDDVELGLNALSGTSSSPIDETTMDAATKPESSSSSSARSTLKRRRKKKAKKPRPTNRVRLPSELGLEARLYEKATAGNPHNHFYDDDDEDDGNYHTDDSGSVILPLSPASGVWSRNMSKWDKVRTIVSLTNRDLEKSKNSKKRKKQIDQKSKQAISGRWNWPSWRDVLGQTREKGLQVTDFVATQTMDLVDMSLESQYAIVTFTSRQAAVAARQCLADGRSVGRWRTMPELAIPPLSDAAACDVFVFRNCCRPVTVTIDEGQKNRRSYIVFILLGGFYFFAPFALSLFAALLNPQSLEDTLPKLFRWLEDRFGDGISGTVSGFLQSVLYTIFFASCPVFFKTLANFGSRASSVANAELAALQYYWWFMVISAFSGTLIANMFLSGFSDGIGGGQVQTVLLSIARAIPSTQGATWLNWIVLRMTFVMTGQYLLQIPAYIWAMIGMKCCSRLSRGGGPGPPTPYRLYVDSGVVLLCVLALAPASPLVAPAAFLYFLWTQPVLRRCIIFVYRPKFDGGGFRYPFVFLMAISSIFVGQILLTLQMVLKQAVGPAVLAAVPILGTYTFARNMETKFLHAFGDAALLQTSLLDGWDDQQSDTVTMDSREKFRKFLVDSHKAAFVPVCLAGGDDKENSLTAEPAVVVPLETDLVKDLQQQQQQQSQQPTDSTPLLPLQSLSLQGGGKNNRDTSSDSETTVSQQSEKVLNSQQHGAMLRRAVQTISAMKRIRPRSNTTGTLDSLAEEPAAGDAEGPASAPKTSTTTNSSTAILDVVETDN